jgi:prepilin-type N-terminal cleavage/methylation domain-containing protein
MYPPPQEENMNKGFTLIEVLVSMTLLLMAVLFSSRIMVAAMDQTRKSALRFRLVEALNYYKNYLSSLPMDSPELAEGAHARAEREFRVDWRVEEAGAFLKMVRLAIIRPPSRLALVLYRSRFIPGGSR